MSPSKHVTTKIFGILLILSSLLLAWWLNIPNNHGQQALNQSRADIEDPRIKISKEAADKINHLNGIRQANVLVMQNNAYVAVVIDSNEGQLTNDMENQIIKQVNSTYLNIRRVNVSANPDYVKCISTYVTNVEHGKRVDDFFEQFNAIVDQNFPRYRD